MNLFQLLKDIVEKDAMIESIKESLAFCTDANLPDLFDFFDYSRKNAIGPMDLAETLKELGIFLSICDLKILYKRFDKDLDGRFDYDEFCDLILPRKYSIAKLMNERMLKLNPNLIVISGKANRRYYEENCYGVVREA